MYLCKRHCEFCAALVIVGAAVAAVAVVIIIVADPKPDTFPSPTPCPLATPQHVADLLPAAVCSVFCLSFVSFCSVFLQLLKVYGVFAAAVAFGTRFALGHCAVFLQYFCIFVVFCILCFCCIFICCAWQVASKTFLCGSCHFVVVILLFSPLAFCKYYMVYIYMNILFLFIAFAA